MVRTRQGRRGRLSRVPLRVSSGSSSDSTSALARDPLRSDSDSTEDAVVPRSRRVRGTVAGEGLEADEAYVPVEDNDSSSSDSDSQPEVPRSSRQQSSSPNVPEHVLVLPGGKFKCTKCNKVFKTRSYIKTHDCIGKEKPYKCEQCPKQFAFKSHYEYHRTSQHTSERPHICPTCNKGFCRKRELKRHEVSHTGEKRYSCGVCPRKFTSNQMLQNHARIHTGEKPFACLRCDKRFHSKILLKRHHLVHLGQTPHRCKVCRRSFYQKSALILHMNKHECEKRYKCEEKGCSMSFTTRRDVTRHIDSVHRQKLPYQCGTCKKQFSRNDNYVRHCRTQHNEKVVSTATPTSNRVRPQPEPRPLLPLPPPPPSQANHESEENGLGEVNESQQPMDDTPSEINALGSHPIATPTNLESTSCLFDFNLRKVVEVPNNWENRDLEMNAQSISLNTLLSSDYPAFCQNVCALKEDNRIQIFGVADTLDTCQSSSGNLLSPMSAVEKLNVQLKLLFSKEPVGLNFVDDEGNNLLFQATLSGKSSADLEAIVKAGVTWKGVTNKNGDNILHITVQVGNLEAVEYFIRQMDETEVNQKNKQGMTPLHLSAIHLRGKLLSEVVLALVENEADDYAVNNEGNNWCFLAVLKGLNTEEFKRNIVMVKHHWKAVNKAKESIIHLAVKANNMSALTYFISNRANVNARDANGNTPLHILQLVEFENPENYKTILDILVQHKAEVNARNTLGITPFHYAATCKIGSELQLMLDMGAELEAKNNRNFAPVHAAVACGNERALSFLLKNKVDIVNSVSEESRTAFHEATFAEKNCIQLVSVLLNRGYKQQIDKADADGNTPFLYAVLNDRSLDEINHFIYHGANWRRTNKRGAGVLHLAANRGNLEVIKYYIEEGADISARSELGGTLLHHAATAKRNFREIVSYLVEEKGMDINATSNSGDSFLMTATIAGKERADLEHVVRLGGDWRGINNAGRSILHLAAQEGSPEVVEYFISLGADVNLQSSNGNTPLHQLMLADTLVSQKLDIFLNSNKVKNINAVNVNGDNVLLFATFEGHGRKLLEKLVNAGADWKAVNEESYSILHLAVEAGNLQAVEYFVKLGADVNAKTNYLETPLHRLEFTKKHALEILKLLVENKADVHAKTRGGSLALHCLASTPGDFAKMVDVFVEKQVDINDVDNDGNTLLHLVARDGGGVRKQKDLRYLVRKISTGRWKNLRNVAGLTVLQMAAKGGNVEALKYLTKRQQLSIKMLRGDTYPSVVHWAILSKNVQVLKQLIDKFGVDGVKENCKCCKKTALEHVLAVEEMETKVKKEMLLLLGCSESNVMEILQDNL